MAHAGFDADLNDKLSVLEAKTRALLSVITELRRENTGLKDELRRMTNARSSVTAKIETLIRQIDEITLTSRTDGE